MRVLHLSLTDGSGGADIAAYRIFEATKAAGVDARMAVRRGVRPDSEAVVVPMPTWSRTLGDFTDFVAARVQKSSNPFHRSLNVFPTGGMQVAGFRPDLIHLHWVGGNALSLREINELPVPVVWTLHDSWPFTGAEHHPLYPDDDRFVTGYRRTRRRYSSRVDVDGLIWRLKSRAWTRSFTLVAPSEWIADQSRRSKLMANQTTRVIPNPVPSSIFSGEILNNAQREISRSEWGVSPDECLLLYGGVGGVSHVNKGWETLRKSLQELSGQGVSVHVVLLGQSNRPEDLPPNIACTPLGRIESEAAMARVYASCDIYVTTSEIESFGLMAAEASASGLAVIAPKSTGLQDVVTNETGWLYDPKNQESLTTAIKQAVQNSFERIQRGATGKHRAIKLWQPSIVGQAYVEVYKQAIGGEPQQDEI